MKPRIKICCIASIGQARMTIGFGADTLDLCSGVRTNGDLDERKLEAFFRAAWG